MISKESGDAVQCANTDMIVMLRPTQSPGSVGVRRSFQKQELVSTLPFKYFKEIEWLEIESDTGMYVSICLLA